MYIMIYQTIYLQPFWLKTKYTEIKNKTITYFYEDNLVYIFLYVDKDEYMNINDTIFNSYTLFVSYKNTNFLKQLNL